MKFGCIYRIDQERFAAYMRAHQQKRRGMEKYEDRTPEEQLEYRKQVAAHILSERCDIRVNWQDLTLWDEMRTDTKCIRLKFHRGRDYKPFGDAICPVPIGCEFPQVFDRENAPAWPEDVVQGIYPERSLY